MNDSSTMNVLSRSSRIQACSASVATVDPVGLLGLTTTTTSPGSLTRRIPGTDRPGASEYVRWRKNVRLYSPNVGAGIKIGRSAKSAPSHGYTWEQPLVNWRQSALHKR